MHHSATAPVGTPAALGAFPRLWEVLRTPQERVICFREKKRERDRQTDRDRLVQRRENTFFTIETPAHRIARLEGVFLQRMKLKGEKYELEREHISRYTSGGPNPTQRSRSRSAVFFFRARQFARFSKFAAPDLWRRRTSCEHYRKPNGRLPRARGPNASALSPL